MKEKKYLYSVRPRRTIKSLPEVGPIRTAKSLYLSKEEVILCLKDATVYRRFAVDQNIQVTVVDLDRLHNDVFYTEKEWKEMQSNKLGEDRGKAENVISTTESEETKVDATVEVPAPQISAEEVSVKDSAVAEDKVAEKESTPIKEEENGTDTPSDDAESAPVEPTVVADNIISDDGEEESEDEIENIVIPENSNPQTSPLQINVSSGKKKHKNKNR